MKRRDFLNLGIITAAGGTIVSPAFTGCSAKERQKGLGKIKNIIFMVSDGMSTGTLNMADLFLQRKEGHGSNWLDLYRGNRIRRALMDTASADSLVTDSSAGSSSWGCGVRVNNGSLNVSPDGIEHKPILQKFKEARKSVGCVTTVPVTHATPAGFCINAKSRSDQAAIAGSYLQLRFDVMMGGGTEFFSKEKRKDGRDLFSNFVADGYAVVQTKKQMNSADENKPLLGVFHEDGLPYTLDQKEDKELMEGIPTLAEMARKAIERLNKNPNGFVLQVEGGKVDWAAHANDAGALLYDQIAFDEAVAVAIAFAENRDDTLVILTTDHGNSNPGLIKSKNVNEKFDLLLNYKYTNEWILKNISRNDTPSRVIELINDAQGYTITRDEAAEILSHYADLDNAGIYNAYKLPFRRLAQIQQNYTSIGWSGIDHSADFVEVAMYGQGSELLKPFVKNTDLHYLMLEATGVEKKPMSPKLNQ
ncbi:MAG: alkaline phosphatase [Mangrovibacterium sp.]